MAKIKLLIRAKTKNQPATVFARFYHGKKIDFYEPTEFKIYPEYWNNKTQSFSKRIFYTETFSEKDKQKLENDFLDLKNAILKKNNSGISITKKILKQIIKDFHHPKTPKRRLTLDQYIENYIQDITTGKRLTEKKRAFNADTTKTIRAFRSQLKNYEKDRTTKLIFSDITMEFYEDFIQYLYSKDYSPNTVGKYIKHLKMIMRASLNEGLHNNTQFERRSFRPPSSKVSSIYLSELELTKLFELDLRGNKPLDHARDVFLIGCYTAQRFSDYSRIKKENIKGGFIEIIQQKTGENVVIPIRPDLDILLKKYEYNLPKTHEQKVNKYIKEVGKLAEINEVITFEKYNGGIKTIVTKPKYELITTHTARRSGCTNMYLAGIPSIDIMKISGHKTEREFLKYIKVTKHETAAGLANHPYFSGRNEVVL